MHTTTHPPVPPESRLELALTQQALLGEGLRLSFALGLPNAIFSD